MMTRIEFLQRLAAAPLALMAGVLGVRPVKSENTTIGVTEHEAKTVLEVWDGYEWTTVPVQHGSPGSAFVTGIEPGASFEIHVRSGGQP